MSKIVKFESAEEHPEIVPHLWHDHFQSAIVEDDTVLALQKFTSPKKFPEVVEFDFKMRESDVVASAKPPQAGCVCEVSNSRGELLKIYLTLYKSEVATQPGGWLIDDWRIVDE